MNKYISIILCTSIITLLGYYLHYTPSVSDKVSYSNQHIEDCTAEYDVMFKIDDIRHIEGVLRLRRFVEKSNVAMEFSSKDANTLFPPALIDLDSNGFYNEIQFPENTPSDVANTLIQLFTQIQWATKEGQYHEKDANGIATTSYPKSIDTKKIFGYEHTNNKIKYSGSATRLSNINSCFSEEVNGKGEYHVKHPISGEEASFKLTYNYVAKEHGLASIPEWMNTEFGYAQEYISNYKIVLDSNSITTRTNEQTPTLKQISDSYERVSRAELRTSIINALAHEDFITNFIDTLLESPDSFDEQLALDIIMYMSHVDSILTQEAILTLVENSIYLPVNFALQSAISMGEFSDIKVLHYKDVALDAFFNQDVNDIVRSASVSSLGRMANKIRINNPSLSKDITLTFINELERMSKNDINSAYMLDSLANTNATSNAVLQTAINFSKSEQLPTFERAMNVIVISGNEQYAQDVLTTTLPTNKQALIINSLTLSKNNHENTVSQYLFSPSTTVRTASLKYLLTRNEINTMTKNKLSKLSLSEDNSSNRALLSALYVKYY